MFRSVRAEEKEARRYSSHKQKAMEILFAKIQDEFEKQEKGRNVFHMLNTYGNGRGLTSCHLQVITNLNPEDGQ